MILEQSKQFVNNMYLLMCVHACICRFGFNKIKKLKICKNVYKHCKPASNNRSSSISLSCLRKLKGRRKNAGISHCPFPRPRCCFALFLARDIRISNEKKRGSGTEMCIVQKHSSNMHFSFRSDITHTKHTHTHTNMCQYKCICI